MSVRERILIIRLMEKMRANPYMADRLGIVVKNGRIIEGEKYGSDKKS